MTTAKITKPTPFFKGRVFEFIICIIAFIAAAIAMLQIPLNAHSDNDQVTTVMFTIFGIEALVAAILFRQRILKYISVKEGVDPPRRFIFAWLLIPAIFVMQIPWIAAGVFNDADVNAIGASAMLFFLPWLMAGLGIVAVSVFWAPVELAARALCRVIKTRGKDGTGQLAMGAYLLLWVAIIIFGVLGASTERVSYQAHNALLSALIGIPGDYTVKDPTFLWVTRILFIIAVALPFIFQRGQKSEKGAGSGVPRV